MNISTTKLNSIRDFHMPRWNELPDVPYYAEQIIQLVNSTFQPHLYNDDNSNDILTNPMINSYVKNNLIEPPEKRKYGKVQIAKLFVICIIKQAYSIQDVKYLINIALNVSQVDKTYDEFCNLFEDALICTYEKKDFIDNISKNNNQYLLKSVLLSCSYKIYAKEIIKNVRYKT